MHGQKNVWFHAFGTFMEQVIKDCISNNGAKRQCKRLSSLDLCDSYQIVIPIEAIKRKC